MKNKTIQPSDVIKEENGDFFIDILSYKEDSISGEIYSEPLNESQIILLSKISTLDFLDFFWKIELAEQIKKISDSEILQEINKEIDSQQEKFNKIVVKEDKRLYYLEKRTFWI